MASINLFLYQYFIDVVVKFSLQNGVLDVPVTKEILDKPRIRALVSQGEPAAMAQHRCFR